MFFAATEMINSNTTASSSDFQKLSAALSTLKFSSLDDVLASIGLANLPNAQRYGILFGFATFFVTICTVATLLIWGGSFHRIAEQSQTGKATIPDAVTVREGRPLLLQRLLDARDRMMTINYPGRYDHPVNDREYDDEKSTKFTKLQQMLMNVAPSREIVRNVSKLATPSLENDDGTSSTTTKKRSGLAGFFGGGGGRGGCDTKEDKDSMETKGTTTRETIRQHIPPGYEANYVVAYRRCQDKPGGPILSGLPEARFEAFARAYAGCGTHTSTSYRRSYARMYEAVCCTSYKTEGIMSKHFESRPDDLVGRTVRLEVLEIDRHVEDVHDITCGEACGEDRAYKPNVVWGFLEYGPFTSAHALGQSPIFNRMEGEASFAIIEATTDKVLGTISLSNDNPKNLSIDLDSPLVKPATRGTVEEVEACFLVMDRLFALGYRRIQLSIDSQDAYGRKLPGRLGFTQEGMIAKDRIVKDSNRDSCIYGMLNSDWDKGARAYLFRKLHGATAQQADDFNNAREGELETQTAMLAEKKEAKAVDKGQEKDKKKN